MCWNLVAMRQENNSHWGVAIWQKPTNNDCLLERQKGAKPKLCKENDADDAWYESVCLLDFVSFVKHTFPE